MRLVLLATALLLLGQTCGQDAGRKTRGEPCTRAAECEPDLSCVGGICKAQSDDAGPSDATTDR